MNSAWIPNESDRLMLQKLAWIQLERAISLFVNDGEFVSSLTLAGAAEELLGVLLRHKGRKPSIENWKELIALIGSIDGEQMTAKEVFTELNHAKNSAKHVFEGQLVEISKDHAIDMLDRAISNWISYTGQTHDIFASYFLRAHGARRQ
jgi:hypothetical protein